MPVMKDPRVSTIIVCGIVRNAETGLRKNIPVINKICSYFRDFKVVIYENDSKDGTKGLLQKWHESFSDKVFVIMDEGMQEKVIPSTRDVNCNPFFSQWRIERMASLRNKYLSFVEDNGWNPDYLMVVDLDVSRISIDGVMSSFNPAYEWDAVSAFGYSYSPLMKKRYHDTFALVETGKENTSQTEKSIYEYCQKYGKIKPDQEWVRVYSAYGGLALYSYESIKGLRYKAILNGDSRVETRCEHFSLYHQMCERGETFVYINPRMVVKYQSVTFGLIWRRLKMIICRRF